MGTPPLQKNGRDQHQDRDLRSLRDSIDAQRKADVEAHGHILEKLSAFDKDLLISHVREEEKSKSEIMLRRQISTLAMLFLSILVGLVAWAATEFRDLHQSVNDNTAHFREFQAIGIEWGDNLDTRDQEFKEDMRQLRRLVNEHQRNKRDHAH